MTLLKITPGDGYAVFEYTALAPRSEVEEWRETLTANILELHNSDNKLYGFFKLDRVKTRHIIRDLIGEPVLDFIITDYNSPPRKVDGSK